MKTTEEQRVELRRLADNHSVLKWPQLIDLLDDFAALEAEKAQWERWRVVARTERDALEAENQLLKKQVEWLVSVLHDIATHAGAVVRTAGGA